MTRHKEIGQPMACRFVQAPDYHLNAHLIHKFYDMAKARVQLLR